MPPSRTKKAALAGSDAKRGSTKTHTSAHSLVRFLLTMIIVVSAFLLLQRAGFFALSGTVETSMSLSAVFLIGIVAATSTCLAVVGGLLLSVSAAWAETHRKDTKWHKIQPLVLFNLGRLAGYTLLGGLIGMLGTLFALTPQWTGVLTILAAFAMLGIGLNIMHVLPKKFCTLPAPLAKRIRSLTHTRHPGAPLLLGALTFFLPCGFTQSMQLLALSTHSFTGGALIMGTFALGTLPSLVGISLVGSFTNGRIGKMVLQLSGGIAVLLGVLSLQSGLVLTGIDAHHSLARFLTRTSNVAAASQDPYVSVDSKGRQIVTVYVTNEGYKPDSFTIEAGRETWFYAIAKQSLAGCTNFLLAPAFNLSTPIHVGSNWLGPVRNPQHDFLISCSVGRFTANIHVKGS